jgi:hypothetical protein
LQCSIIEYPEVFSLVWGKALAKCGARQLVHRMVPPHP